MEAEFWHRRWETNAIGFHEATANPLLVAHFGVLGVPMGGRVFLPLCGKTLSIGWLLSRGYEVVGAELSELAVGQLFAGLGMTPETSETGRLKRYRGSGLDVLVGDIFDVDRAMLGPVDAVFDRAALVALPAEVRGRYAVHVADIAAGAPQLVLGYEYDQSLMNGPPFSVTGEEIRQHYEGAYEVIALADEILDGGIRQAGSVRETVWHMKHRH